MVVVIVPGLPEILEPFLQPNSEPFAMALPADKMTEDEQQHFPQYAKYMSFLLLNYSSDNISAILCLILNCFIISILKFV